MREILFRGKRTGNGEWVEGNYFIEEQDIGDGIIWRDVPVIQQQYGDHFNCFEIDPATIGQYTGLVDKNGKKIFEGDIVKQRNEIGTIYYERNYCTFAIVLKRNADLFQHIKYKCEIIGNIHDNPELLR